MTQDKGKLIHAHPANELTEKLFGFESVIAKAKMENADATAFSIHSDTVPSGKIWKITYISAFNDGGDVATSFRFHVVHNGSGVDIKYKPTSTAQYETVEVSGDFYLDVDDYISTTFKGVAVGESCRLFIFGYEMNAP